MRYKSRIRIKSAVLIYLIVVIMLSGMSATPVHSTQDSTVEVTESSKKQEDPKSKKRYIVKYKNLEKGKHDLEKQRKKADRTFKNVPYITTELTTMELAAMRKDNNIEFIEEDHPIELLNQSLSSEESTTTEADEQDQYTENIRKVGAVEAHRHGVVGEGVKVAVLDTGIDKESPELRIAGGVSFVRDELDYDDYHGHGTSAEGIIAAVQDYQGLIGISPKVELYAVKVLNSEGIGSYSQVIQGIDWAIEQDMNVISLSLGGRSDSIALQEVVAEADSPLVERLCPYKP